ncbi:hypothetical protein Lal_00014885 [Lupinus albus]|nr:hypothetical protein Lal_00014885 [Lupinus albus]
MTMRGSGEGRVDRSLSVSLPVGRTIPYNPKFHLHLTSDRAAGAWRRWAPTGEREISNLPFAWAATDWYALVSRLPCISIGSRPFSADRCLVLLSIGVFHVCKRSHARQRRPGTVGCHPEGKHPPAGPHRADRIRELHVAGRDAGPGLAADQQVRRRLSGQALLRRLRIRRHRRAAGHRPREATVRRRSRERPAELRFAGEPGRVLRHAETGRHHHGHVAGRRRPPDPRHGAEHVG